VTDTSNGATAKIAVPIMLSNTYVNPN
jgi:hypothetical protein